MGLSCPLCSCQSFPSLESLQTRLVQAATKQLNCPVCPDILYGLDKLTIHLFSHCTPFCAPQHECKDAQPWRCDSCSSDAPESYFQCSKCKVGFQHRAHLEMHVCEVRCRQCQDPVASVGELHHHLAQCHSDRSHLCHLCLKAFKTRGSLHVHVRVAHKLDAGLEKKSAGKRQVKSGVEVKGTEEEHVCGTCKKAFKKEQHLTQHMKTHDGKQWECDVCNKFFTTKYFLKKHKRLHTGETPYCCEICGRTFTFQQSYHKHMLYHTDDRPHQCSDCGKAFKELSTLQNHQRIHTGEKPFSCETCGKSFRQRVSYLVHRRIHTGAMPYKCTACGKTFRYKVSQQTHKCESNPPGTVVKHASEFVQRLLETVQRHNEGDPSTLAMFDAIPVITEPGATVTLSVPVSSEVPEIPPTAQIPLLPTPVDFNNVSSDLVWSQPWLDTQKSSEETSRSLQNLSLASPPKPSSPNASELDNLLNDCHPWLSSSLPDQTLCEFLCPPKDPTLQTINQDSVRDLLSYDP